MTVRARAVTATLAGIAAVAGGLVAMRDRAGPKVRHVLAEGRRFGRRARGRARYARGWLKGAAYRLSGRHPAEDVDDEVLAERVRTTLGPVHRELDIPRLNVTAYDGVVDLRGHVASESDVARIEEVVGAVPGVRQLRTHLHVGLGPGETRPSEGRRHPTPSPARRDLLGAVRSLAVGDDEEVERLTGAALAGLFLLLPEGEAEHVRTHLPRDVRELIRPPRELPITERLETPEELFAAVADLTGRTVGTVEPVVRAVFSELRRLVPEEIDDVEAVLPGGLKALWREPLLAA